jgi:hypothetical protein
MDIYFDIDLSDGLKTSWQALSLSFFGRDSGDGDVDAGEQKQA